MKRNITPPELELDIGTIEQKINDELGNIRGMVETFLNNPEPPVWIPPSLLFHNLDVCDNEEIEMIFGHGAHQYCM